ncbi:MAG: hypothetical protein P8100_04930 [bacterium]
MLTVLCILTFIGSGVSFLANGFLWLTQDAWIEAMEEGAFEVLKDTLEIEAIELLLHVNPTYFLMQTLLFALSITGAWLMWKLKKAGFHLYTVAQILLLIIGKIYIPALPFPIIPLLIVATFVTLYARNLRYMH